MFRNMLPVTALLELIRFGPLGRSLLPFVRGTNEVAVLFEKKVLVEGTAHTMNTTETLLQCPDVVAQTTAVEVRQGHWLKSMLTPRCHKQNTFPWESSVKKN